MPTTITEPRNYGAYITQLIETLPAGTPIFTDEITDRLVKEFCIDLCRARKIVNTNMNRLNGLMINNFRKGVYYKPKQTAFGKAPLNPTQLILKKYIKRDENVLGYETGASLIQKLGLTTQIPKYQYIATNEVNHKGNKVDIELKVILRKPKVEITNENFKYLQILDVIENKDAIIIDAVKPLEIINEFILKNQLDFGRLVAFAVKKYSKEVFNRVGHLAEVTRL